MALDKKAVAHIAHLARLQVSEAELEQLAGELNNIIGWIEQLGEVDTEGVAPMTSVVDVTLPWRKDIVDDGAYPDKVLANAPDPEGAFYTVPKVVE